jgi:hypothetical protein
MFNKKTICALKEKNVISHKDLQMTYTDRHIVETYTKLLEGLSSLNKMELIESLSKSLKKDKKEKDKSFYKSFGAFDSTKSAEEIIEEIRSSRKFRSKDIKF